MYSSSLEELIGTVLQTYVQVAILAAGAVGNVLAFIVFTRPFFSKTSIGFYLRALAITDTAVIISNVISFVIFGLQINFMANSAASCKIVAYIFFIPNAVSAWLEALVSLDRMLNVVAPSRFSFLKTAKFSRIMLVAIIVYNCALYSPILFFYDLMGFAVPLADASVNETGANISNATLMMYNCDYTDYAYFSVLSWYDLFNSILVPCFIMLVSAVLVVRKLYKSRNKVAKRPIQNTSLKANSGLDNGNSRRRVHRDRHFAITSVSLCLVFLTLNIGLALYNILSSMISMSFLVFNVVFVIYTINYSVKFYLYLLVNRSFLLEFKNIVFMLSKRAHVSLEATSAITHPSKTRNKITTVQ